MHKLPNPFGRHKSEGGGGPERATHGEPLPKTAADPHAGIIGMLIGETALLPDWDALLGELNILTATKSLDPAEQREIANKVLEARAKKQEERQS